MPTLDEHYMPRIPARHRVTLIEDSDVATFTQITDCFPRPDGTYQRDRMDRSKDIALVGSYFIEELDEEGVRTGRFHVLSAKEFKEQFTVHRQPPVEYGIQWLPDPEQVVQHPHPERCREVMGCLPELKLSGEYRIVTRLGASAPGPWEPLEDIR